MRSLERMGSRGSGDYRARRRERERQRRQQQERAAARQGRSPAREAAPDSADGSARRGAATDCGWCGSPITPRSRRPIPKWCSATCRKRAWEQKRAAASGRCAVEIVERVIVTPAPPRPIKAPRHGEWADLLQQLTGQIDCGLIYDRDLTALARAVDEVIAALRRRPHRR